MTSQIGRFVRLYAFGVATALTGTLNASGIHGASTSKLTLAGVVALGAPLAEVADRQLVPGEKQGKLAIAWAAFKAVYAQGKVNSEPKKLLVLGSTSVEAPGVGVEPTTR